MIPHPFACPDSRSSASKLRKQLRPDRDHPDEQRDRRQCRSLLHENSQHIRLLLKGTYEEHCSFFVLGVNGADGSTVPEFCGWLTGHANRTPAGAGMAHGMGQTLVCFPIPSRPSVTGVPG